MTVMLAFMKTMFINGKGLAAAGISAAGRTARKHRALRRDLSPRA